MKKRLISNIKLINKYLVENNRIKTYIDEVSFQILFEAINTGTDFYIIM